MTLVVMRSVCHVQQGYIKKKFDGEVFAQHEAPCNSMEGVAHCTLLRNQWTPSFLWDVIGVNS